MLFEVTEKSFKNLKKKKFFRYSHKECYAKFESSRLNGVALILKTYTHTHTHTYTYTHRHTHRHTHIHIHIHTHRQTHTHTYTHTHTPYGDQCNL